MRQHDTAPDGGQIHSRPRLLQTDLPPEGPAKFRKRNLCSCGVDVGKDKRFSWGLPRAEPSEPLSRFPVGQWRSTGSRKPLKRLAPASAAASTPR